MIDLRFHLVSTTAVFLALAVGVVLGTTVLQDPVLSRLSEDTEALEAQAERLREDRAAVEDRYEAAAAVAEAGAGAMLEEALEDRTVVVVQAPGTDPRAADAVLAQVTRAGGEVQGILTLAERYLAPEEETFLRELTDQVAGESDLPEGGARERAAALLAAAVLGEPEDDGEEADAAAGLAAFAEAGLLEVEGAPEQGAELMLVSDSGPAESAVSEERTSLALADFGAAAEEAGFAAVGAGPLSSARGEGLVAHIRDTGSWSTVDAYGDTPGAVLTVLALGAASQGEVVHYGTGPGAEALGVPEP